MAQTGYTPISIYYSATSTNTPTAGNLVAGELAINTADGKLFYKDSAGVVQVIGTKGGVGTSSTTQVLYNSSGLVVGSANMTFDGTKLTLANDASISGLTVGKGASSVSTNSVLGYQAGQAVTSGGQLVAIGYQSAYSNTTGGDNVAIGGYQALYSNTTGSQNIAIGRSALSANTTGGLNVSIGYQSLYSNTTSSYATAIGYQSGYSKTTGSDSYGSSYLGFQSGKNTSTGIDNTFVGGYAGYTNTTGSSNVALGSAALNSNTTASENTAVGYQAGYTNTTGTDIVALGYQALYSNTTGGYNVAVGQGALRSNTTAQENTSVGNNSLRANTTGASNVAMGAAALFSNTTASGNTAVGYQALYTSNRTADVNAYNTAVGYQAGYSTTTGQFNTFQGFNAGFYTTGSGNTFIGANPAGTGAGNYVTTGAKNTIIGGYGGNQGGLDIRTASNYIVLSDGDGNPRQVIDGSGNYYYGTSTYSQLNSAIYNYYNGSQNFLAWKNTGATKNWYWALSTANQIYFLNNGSTGVTITDGATSWSAYSDSRLKDITGTYTNALADIAQLEPVKFNWKTDADKKPCVGVIAQSVAKVVPEAVDFSKLANADEINDQTEYLSVRYTELIPLLIASIQELNAKITALEAQLGAK